MTEQTNYEDFAEQVNTKFFLTENEKEFEIKLVEATVPVINASQKFYSLFFTSPKDYFLPQKTYELRHDELGEVTLFLVPIGETEDRFRYQAVFNLLIEPEN